MIATSALTGASLLAIVILCVVVLIFLNAGESLFERFQGGALYTVWCIFAAGVGIVVLHMLLHR